MTTSKSNQEGLKPQECERSSGRSKPPISYIPAAMDTPKVLNKVKVSDKMTFSVIIFNEGSPEQFLNHVQTSLEIISQRGLGTDCQEACKADLKAEKMLTVATEAKENYQGTDENAPVIKSWKKATAAKTPLLGSGLTASPGQMCMGMNIPQNAQHNGPPFGLHPVASADYLQD